MLNRIKRQNVVLGALVAAAAALGLWGFLPRVGSTPTQAKRPTVVHLDNSLIDPLAGLSVQQHLEKVISPPAVVGYVRGVITSTLGSSKVGGMTFTDYRMRLTGFVGPSNPGYRDGSEVTVRIPGGQIGHVAYVADDAPELKVGGTYYVIVYGLGTFDAGGGNSLSRLVGFVRWQDVFSVENGEVRGQGPASSYKDTEPDFVAHLNKRKAPSPSR